MDNDQLRQPFFSVVIPLYNKANQIGKTLESVFGQTFTDYEIVIVDDGSTDNSAAEVEKIMNRNQETNFPNIRLICQLNAGVSAARNRGIEEARGKYIALLDGDDEWKPEYLATQAELIRKYPECEVFATNYEFYNGKTISTILTKIKFHGIDGIMDNYFQVSSCSNPPIWTSAVCIKKLAFESIDGFPVGIKQGEDLLTWARLASQYKIAYNLTPLAIFKQEDINRFGKPKRIPPKDDYVGEELLNLKKEFNPPYINQYISFWHKMRSVLFWRLGEKKQGRKEAVLAIRFNPLNYKAYALLILNTIPLRKK